MYTQNVAVCRLAKVITFGGWLQRLLVIHCFKRIVPEEVSDIESVDANHQGRAAFMLIDKILKCSQPGKWKAFIEAIEKADYPYVASLLKSEDQGVEQCQHQKKILQIFAPYLQLQLEPREIINYLGVVNLVNSEDIEEIKACQTNNGAVAATMLMLDRLQRRQGPSKWYIDFLKILYQKGHKDIVREMEPDFTLDCEVLKTPVHFIVGADSEVDQNDCVEDMIEEKVMYFKSELTAFIKVKNIAPTLCQLIESAKVCQLLQISSRKEAIESMLDEIRKLESRTKWRSFINCLTKSDYSHVADVLSRPGVWKLQCEERELLRLLTPEIGPQLDPAELVPHLEEDGLINSIDKEDILSTFRQSGCSAASLVLLDCLQCRAAPHVWFRTFIKILVKCGREDLATAIDSEYHKEHEGPEEAKDGSPSCTHLLRRRDEALSHIYKLDKAVKRELEAIQMHFSEKIEKLKDEIENRTSQMTKSLKEVDESLKKIDEDEADISEDVAAGIEEKLKQITSTNYVLVQEDAFKNLKVVGVLRNSRHVLERQNSFDTSSKNSWNSGRRQHYMKYKVNAERQQSTSSSSSSQTSAYVAVKSASLSSSSSAGDFNAKASSHEIQQSTSSSSLSRSSVMFGQSSSHSTHDLNANTSSPSLNEKGIVEQGRFKLPLFETVPEDSELDEARNSFITNTDSLAGPLELRPDVPSSPGTVSIAQMFIDNEEFASTHCDHSLHQTTSQIKPANAEVSLFRNGSIAHGNLDLTSEHHLVSIESRSESKEISHVPETTVSTLVKPSSLSNSDTGKIEGQNDGIESRDLSNTYSFPFQSSLVFHTTSTNSTDLSSPSSEICIPFEDTSKNEQSSMIYTLEFTPEQSCQEPCDCIERLSIASGQFLPTVTTDDTGFDTNNFNQLSRTSLRTNSQQKRKTFFERIICYTCINRRKEGRLKYST